MLGALRWGSQRFSMIVACVPLLALLFGRWITGDGISLMECIAIGLVSTGVLYGAFSKDRELNAGGLSRPSRA